MISEPVAGSGPEAAAPRVGVPLQTRGSVQLGALYVTRPVDEALVAALQAGRWAVVLGPRFSGKSSLRVRTARALLSATAPPVDRGPAAPLTAYRCATIEARSLASSSAGAVYLALCTTLAAELRLPAVSTFWQRYLDEPPVERFQRYLLQEVATAGTRTVILLDDIDALQAVPELLAALGQVHDTLAGEQRAGALILACFSSLPIERLVTTPGASARWTRERFLLADFSRAELSAFAPALTGLLRSGDPTTVHPWLDAVFAWTAGHPQLTQHLCQQLVARGPSPVLTLAAPADPAASEAGAEPEERISHLVRRLFLDQDDAVHEEPCLQEAVQALLGSPQAQALLTLYRRLLSGVPVTPDPLDALQRELRLCGLAGEADDTAGTPRLRPRCRLIATLLGETWAREQEVRLLLKDAIAREAAPDPRAPAAALLRGVPLKTAQAWARRHPEALRPPEVRVLLASLEAARSEAEARHQASAATLQRERRDKTQTHPGGESTQLPTSSFPRSPGSSGRPQAARSWTRATVVIVALALGLVATTLASVHQRAVRLEQASQEAAARAVRAEQALRTLQAAQTPTRAGQAHATEFPALLRRPAEPPRVQAHASASPAALRRPAEPSRPAGALLPAAAADRRKPALSAPSAGPSLLSSKKPPTGRAANRKAGTCPAPGRPAD